MQEVEAKYKTEITAELREEYSISKMVPLDNPRHPPPGNSNVGFSAIKTELLDANYLTNSVKKVVQLKGILMVLTHIHCSRKSCQCCQI